MLKKFLFGLAALILLCGTTRAAIVYTPNANMSFWGSEYKIDFNKDSVIDLFMESSFISTNSIPPSSYDSYYFNSQEYIGGGPSGSIFQNYSGRLLVGTNSDVTSSLLPGTSVGAISPNGSRWSQQRDTPFIFIMSSGPAGTGTSPAILGLDYLGFQFAIESETHYGWMLVDRRPYSEAATSSWYPIQDGPRILSWAYESNANTPISVGAIPEPASCGAAIFSAVVGALAMRRKMNRSRN